MKTNITKIIYLDVLEIMKSQLDLLKFKFGKNSEEFKFYKSETMNNFYSKLEKLFATLETEKIIKKCPNHCNLRKGYSDCKNNCGGSGYITKEKNKDEK